MAQLPVIRKKPENEQEFLLKLTITHPTGPEGPQFECKWDGEWVAARNFPPAFAQQVFATAFQILFAAALIGCGIIPPQSGLEKN